MMLKVRRTLVAVIALLATTNAGLGTAAETKYNILLICSDDHAAWVTGVYGNAWARTPHIDRLAASGVTFTRAYCNSPVCTASRQSFLTGRYPRSLGVTQLQTPLPRDAVTLAELFAAAGYRTAAIGKMHFNSDLPHGFGLRIDEREFAAVRREQPAGPLPEEGIEILPPWRPFKDPAAVWLNAGALPFGAVEADMQGTYFATQGADYLRQAAEARQPFFLMVSFYEPHSPFRFPIEMAGRRRGDEFTVPDVAKVDEPDVPAEFRDLNEADKRGIAAAYHTSVEFMDRNVGRVLTALDEAGLADSTIVVYLSDHGYLLGQHGRFEKHCMFEPAVRVPLIVRMPDRDDAGRQCQALVELVDLAPTLVELCGLAPAESLQGSSLAPLITGDETGHRDHVIVEYAPNDELMITDGRWKLIYERGARRRSDGYDPGTPLLGERLRLFDLDADPQEIVNLAAQPAQAERVENMLLALAGHVRRTDRRSGQSGSSDDPLAILRAGCQPRDVTREEALAE